ncbi:MAG TPA: NAD(P)-dependent oxidoreductase [Chloroflexus aurantiacus]|jgi:nucleoside-diphosphate-sugar epimerase|uniref:NAD-dependent epimerase/dehydratase n=1 Tax=Chloroflexus aurantiacus (strain ATCC 29366 / DSM 635 / J-10-fl) TaxID=324602 RepID=A9WF17_CHLAA|nr:MULTISPECIES: NAD(P)-dependent oxidoreductase [Chloroflexus]ABY35332.1 NAD-dependent epimerase/dehydratase [Chloroflexus aurantiacus J-10-fl]RMG45982.1 MAG: NAD(P)-dependent oxidoreductase [Chloroflexota bacterium]GIV92252.1 MAG: epimerase [Chloroflexus sp.]HBW66508.1 NAD(P)-dependent oxidoreductase [Chloroflexus aurantiacus]
MTSAKTPHALITGGAGYIGSLLTGVLLNQGWSVTVVDDLLFGGASLLGYWHHPRFRFAKGDICDPATLRATGDGIAVGDLPPASFDAVIHLAAIVGFPACQMVGPQVAWRYNFEGTKRVFAAAEAGRVGRFVFASTYSNYGLSPDGKPVTEESPLNPQSLYAETKIAAEQFLRENTAGAATMPILFRFATLFGVSPRTRFDLIINQFVLEAITRRKLIIYQRGYARSFVHVRDVCDAILLGLEAPEAVVNREIFNVGSDEGNYTKDEIVALVQRHVEGTVVEYKDLTFGGDMRDIRVSFAKIRERLGFRPRISVEQGIREVASVLTNGVIKDALDSQYRNAQFIVQ